MNKEEIKTAQNIIKQMRDKFATPIWGIDKKQRAFDGRWEVIGQILRSVNNVGYDPYTYKNEDNEKIVAHPFVWATIDVVDHEFEVHAKYGI